MLVIITPGFPKDEEDSTCLPAVQKIILSLIDELGADNIRILSLHYPFEKKQYYWHKVSVEALGGSNVKGYAKLKLWWKAFWILDKWIHETTSAKLLAFWLIESSLLAQLVGFKTKTKRLFWLHGQDVKKENKYVRLIRAKPHQLAAISSFSQRSFEHNHGIKPAHLLFNGIYEPAFPAFNTAARTIDIMAAGSLIPLKNYALFLEVLNRLVLEFPHLKCIHVGEGPLAEKLLAESKLLGLDQHLQFLGNCPHAQVLDLMNDSRVFLHTSSFEGSSTVIAEALYSGCQVVSTVSIYSEPRPHLHLANTAAELTNAVSQALKNNLPAIRIKSHDLKETSKDIRRILEL
jgi:glycosyltransferase involved in cell wall biosynthesis